LRSQVYREETTLAILTDTRNLAAGAWQLDTVHSRLGFAVEYMVGSFHAAVAPFQATLTVAEDGTATLAGKALVENIQVGDEALQTHLGSPEFFDAERTPEITFASARFDPTRDRITIVGQLAIKGTALPVELAGTLGGPLVDPYGRERVNLTLEATVDRGAFGLDWNTELPSGDPALAQDVKLVAELALVRFE
jgi:polyisoprenoid-binding protein YceI